MLWPIARLLPRLLGAWYYACHQISIVSGWHRLRETIPASPLGFPSFRHRQRDRAKRRDANASSFGARAVRITVIQQVNTRCQMLNVITDNDTLNKRAATATAERLAAAKKRWPRIVKFIDTRNSRQKWKQSHWWWLQTNRTDRTWRVCPCVLTSPSFGRSCIACLRFV